MFHKHVVSFGGVSDPSPADIAEDAYRDLYVWIFFRRPESPVVSEYLTEIKGD